MRLSLLTAAFLITTGAAFAQAPDAKPMETKPAETKPAEIKPMTAPAATPATKDGAPHAATGSVGQPLESGANSFTEAQVKERFAKMGFGTVKDLRKDDAGIWRGTAEHAGKPVTIGMDFKGNVAAQ
ncbi:hypothetical protein ASG40_09935 [Methylobacterium sp. Leaf399]|uniref:hypothetical protein n=1 Tax=Methylobacterium sp. Leaf399 TaxID=1736364 RepID=UPI0006F9E964|nr:hypothetical protein ASG40_09935 [Methylobacterium sp. Leaf399]